jgi:hypothetical protein
VAFSCGSRDIEDGHSDRSAALESGLGCRAVAKIGAAARQRLHELSEGIDDTDKSASLGPEAVCCPCWAR